MAFALANLSYSMASGKGARLHSYHSTADTLATIRAANYFDSAQNATRFKVGDIILVNASDGFGINVVSAVSVSAGTVTLSAENVTSA